MLPHDQLLKAIRERQQKNTEFNGGILTADRYVTTIRDCIGSDACNKFAGCSRSTSFEDLVRKAAKTLTYNNPDMVVDDLYSRPDEWKGFKLQDGTTLELPEKTLMVFKHTLTTPRKDRDGDIMRTQGAKPDPKMLLLWQHVHTLPIGKLITVVDHNSKRLTVISAIVDMNELCHDSAVMIDSKMGRFSHGFRAMEFSQIKDVEDGDGEGGFDIKLFEIMEESLVSVPSNTDAEVEDVLLSLTEGGKLKSSLMKSVGKSIREKKPKSVSVGTDVGALKIALDIKVNGQSIESGDRGKSTKTKCAGDQACGCGCQNPAGAPEKTNADAGKEKGTDDEKVMVCPKCGETLQNGNCPKCGVEAADKSAKSVKPVTKGFPAYVYAGQLEKSYESISYALRGSLRKYLEDQGVKTVDENGVHLFYSDVIGTFKDYAILTVDGKDGTTFYKAAWRDGDNGPELFGNLRSVKIETTTKILEKSVKRAKFTHEKAGRTINGKNRASLTHAHECVEEVHDKEPLSKSGKVLCKEAIKAIKDVIATADKPEEEASTNTTAKQAAAILIAKGTPEDHLAVMKTLGILLSVSDTQRETKEIESLLGIN
jgi:hypothetical protein